MKLPIPLRADGRLYTEVELTEATAGTVASTRAEAERGASYQALLEWCSGVVRTVTGPDGDVSDRADVRRLVRLMPFESVMVIACMGMAKTKGDDSVPGAYECPQCGQQVIVGKYQEDGEEVDTSDHLGAIDYQVAEDPDDGISFTPSRPVEIMRRDGDVAEVIESVALNWPTLGMCIRAQQRHADDDSKLQSAVYAEALRAVNAKPVTAAWRSTYGDLIFQRMLVRDSIALNREMKRYSLQTSVERVCMKCRKRWSSEIDLRGFFASGLTG